ncbi:MAG: threonine synthase, partial [Parvibaculaceae bacterium]
MTVRYVSTRGEAPELGFEDVLLTGLARDGGLYVPAQWPRIGEAELRSLRGSDYGTVAHRVIAPYVGGEIADDELKRMIAEAYAHFGHAAVTPLRQLAANHWLLEL